MAAQAAHLRQSPADLRGFCLEGDIDPGSVYLRPVGLMAGTAGALALERGARRLAGGRLVFDRAELIVRRSGATHRTVAHVDAVAEWAARRGLPVRVDRILDALSAPRPPLAGLRFDRPLVMGIVNVTPDSFSDGGAFLDTDRAIAHGRAMLAVGADILDIGGESTRPGAAPVPAEEEMARVLPVVEALAGDGAVVSIDTRHAATMRAALSAGARILNDVTALAGDAESLSVARESGAPTVLMHMQGEPRTMQEAPRYDDAPLDVFDFLRDRIAACEAAGIPRGHLVVDAGIGFGKTVAHNVELLDYVGLLHGFGCPVMMGASRKRFLGSLSRGEPPPERVPGGLAAGLHCWGQGCQILRVHDVAETTQARAVWEALHPIL